MKYDYVLKRTHSKDEFELNQGGVVVGPTLAVWLHAQHLCQPFKNKTKKYVNI